MDKQVTIASPDYRPDILIVDDDPSILMALSTLFCQYTKVTTASCVKEACKSFTEKAFEVVVTDFELGDGNGLDVVNFIRNRHVNIPVIMITAYGNKDRVIDTINHQVFGYIEKPFDPDMVEEMLRRALQKKQKDDLLNKFAKLGESAGQLIHEIANPLSIISMEIEVLQALANQAHNDDIINKTNSLSEPTQRIKHIIEWTKNSLKNSAQIKAETFQMREILDALRKECLPKAAAHKVQIVITPDSDVRVVGDKAQLLAALVNLVNNGVEAVTGCVEKWVMLDVKRASGGLQITVTDSGPGIPVEIRDKIFKPLFTTKKDTGTGLGLVIVQKVLEAHGGHIFLNHNNKNTQFVINLPSVV